ncbi:uncharacterized protein LOC119742160 isoform X2 [Patiria miniata]|uniref:Ig-like domain-containing protein n=1 Tax=Patiria miniata TaxID=46514 RepID=A0A914BD16_PATMI|nr:uncharacterized protein LOC119742160 isoform X2 [Patiria miniata]
MDLTLVCLLLCWYSHRVSALLPPIQVTTAISQPADAEPTEGDTVTLACNASGLLESYAYTFDWHRHVMGTTWEPVTTNGIVLNARYFAFIIGDPPATTTAILIVRNVTRDDRLFECRVSQNGNQVSAPYPILTVRYFPSDLYPICAPSGSFTVPEGATLLMNCTTEPGYPLVWVEIIQSTVGVTWSEITGDEIELVLSSQLSVSADHQDATFTFNVTSASAFPGRASSCSIGPLHVLRMETPGVSSYPDAPTAEPGPTNNNARTENPKVPTQPDAPTTAESGPTNGVFQTTPDSQTDAAPVAWIVVSVVLLILLAVSVPINAVFITRCWRHRRSKTSHPQVPDVELEPGGKDTNAYLVPTNEEATGEAVYQTVLETKEPEYTYVASDENIEKISGHATVDQSVSKTEGAKYTYVASDENIGKKSGPATVDQSVSKTKGAEYTDVASDETTGKKSGLATVNQSVSETEGAEYTYVASDETIGKTSGPATVDQSVSETEEAEYTDVVSNETVGKTPGSATFDQSVSETEEAEYTDVVSNETVGKTPGPTPDEKHYQNVKGKK